MFGIVHMLGGLMERGSLINFPFAQGGLLERGLKREITDLMYWIAERLLRE